MVLPRGTWTMERVVDELRRLAASGEPVNRQGLLDAGETALVSAAERTCGSFSRAVALAGIAYAPRKPAWSEERVIAELRRLHASGVALSCEQLRRDGHGSLVTAAKKHCGNWRKANAKAGVPTYRRGRWTSWEQMQDQLRALHAAGTVMSIVSLEACGFADLAEAARVHVGSWNGALERAGIPVAFAHEHWSRERVIAELRALHAEGMVLNWNIVKAAGHDRLVKAAARHFKSWALACYAAVPDHKPLMKRWTLPHLLLAIQRRHRSGKSMRSTEVQRDEQPLTSTARRLGLSWREACDRAGIPMSALAPRPPPVTRRRWTRAALEAELRAAAAAGTPLIIRSFTPAIVAAVLYRWDSWAAAMRSAGLLKQYERDHAAALASRMGGAVISKKKSR